MIIERDYKHQVLPVFVFAGTVAWLEALGFDSTAM
jgi:hypothetical protein